LKYRQHFANKIDRDLPPIDATTDSANAAPVPDESVAEQSPTNGYHHKGNALSPCTICGAQDWLIVDGCSVCQSCGYSKCG
jgi:hypothetical protein